MSSAERRIFHSVIGIDLASDAVLKYKCGHRLKIGQAVSIYHHVANEIGIDAQKIRPNSQVILFVSAQIDRVKKRKITAND